MSRLRAPAGLWYDNVRVMFNLVNTSNYRLVKTDTGGIFRVQTLETACCPICGEALTLRGHCTRGVIFGSGKKVVLIIRRLRCSGCKRMHNELPDCIVPYKRLCAAILERVINGAREGVSCDERTLRRILDWWRVVGAYFSRVLTNLAEALKISRTAAPAFKETVRAAVNSNNWIFAHQVCTRSVLVSGRRAW